jgi:hypothetical protein
MKINRELLETFAAKHVQRSFKDRFLHEAINKPVKLQSRICHTINDVFPESYRDGARLSVPFDTLLNNQVNKKQPNKSRRTNRHKLAHG